MRASVTSLSKKLISTLFAATLAFGLVPSAAFAAPNSLQSIPEGMEGGIPVASSAEGDDTDAFSHYPSEEVPSADGDAAASPTENETDNDLPMEDASASYNEKDGIEDDVQTGDDSNLTIPAVTERINEDVMLTSPVAEQESTRTYFLAQTLESTKTIPVVSASLPLDTGTTVDVAKPEDEGSSSEEEDGESSENDPDSGDLASVGASFSLRDENADSAVSAESTVIGSFTYRGITYAVEPGGETVAIVAADYTKLPEDFIEAKAIVLPSMVTPDGIDYYSVTRIADYAFSSLNSNEAGIDAITVPASITGIGDNAYTDFNTLQYILVLEDNQQYSQYDGCLYTADQTRLLLIPEGRLGAVRIPSTATIIPEDVSSHCASLTSLIVEPGSAAHHSLQRMDDTNLEIITDLETPTNFTYVNLGEFETKEEALAAAQVLLAEEEQDEVVLAIDSIENTKALIRNNVLFATASLGLISHVSDSEGELASAIQFRSVQNADNFNNARGATYANWDALPAWIKTELNSSAFNKNNSPSFTLYGASDYSTTVNNIVENMQHICVPHKDRYSITGIDSSVIPSSLGQEVTTAAGYDSTSGMSYQRSTQTAKLGWNPTFGFCVYSNGGNRPMLRATEANNTVGTAIKCRYALKVTYSKATKMYTGFSEQKVNHVVLLPGECKVTWSVGYSCYGDFPTQVSPWYVPKDSQLSQAEGSPKSIPVPTSDHYTFDHWNEYEKPEVVPTMSTVISDDISYHASWNPKTYTLTVNPNGGKISNSTASKAYTMKWYLWDHMTIGPFTRTGWTFTGLYTASSGGEKVYAVRSGTTDYADGIRGTSFFGVLNTNVGWRYGANTTAYAQWSVNTYTISFNANGGSGGQSANVTATADQNMPAISTTKPTRNGYTFGGWYDTSAASGGTQYYTAACASARTWDKGSNTTLYARWTPIGYKITYNLNSGTLPSGTANPGSYNVETATFNLPTPTRNYYTFGGWYAASNFSGTATSQIAKGTTGDKTFYAKWNPVGYKITYNLNGGSLQSGTANPGSYNIETATFNLPTPSRGGYTFGGWYAASNFSGSATTQIAKGTTGDKTFYAKWNTVGYKVTYVLNGGALPNGTANPGSYNIETATFNLPTPTWTGYDFGGWYAASNLTGSATVQIAKGTTGDKTFYAKWTPIPRKLILKTLGKDGNWTQSESTYAYNSTITLPGGTISTGWDFDGWYTDEGFKDKVSGNPSSTTMKDLTFYARYVAHTHTLTFDPNGGTGGQSAPVTATYDSVLPKIKEEKPVRAGYQFTGWEGEVVSPVGVRYYTPFYTKDCTSDKIITYDYDVALRAAWSREPFNAISLVDERLKTPTNSIWYWPGKGYTPTNVNGLPEDGSRDNEIKLVSKDDEDSSIVAAPSFEDYRFEGYFDENGVKKIDENGNLLIDEVITEATVWYAHWTRHGSTVKLAADYGEMVSGDIVQGTDSIKHVSFGKDFATPTGEDASRIETIAQTPIRVGYTFLGYYTKENPELSTEDVKNGDIKGTRWIYGEGEEGVSAGTLVGNEWPTEADWNKLGLDDEEDSNAVVLYAAWQLDDCIVKFNTDTDDGAESVVREEGALQDRIWHYNKNMSDILPTPSNDGFSRNGYDFDGWYYVKDGTEVRVCDKEGTPTEVLLPWTDPTKNVTLYAYWIPRHYALEFLPAFPNVEGVEQVYEGEKTIEDIAYDEKLTMVSPEFGAYDFAGWYVGIPDELGGWKANDVPFADWTLRNGEFKEGVHTTDVVEKDGAYVGRFTPQEPFVSQFLVEGASEPAVIHIVAKWEDPVERTFTLYVGEPGVEGEGSLRERREAKPYPFATPISFPETWAPEPTAGWEFEGWVEVGSDSATDEENVQAALDAIERADVFEGIGGTTKIEPKVTRASYRNLHYVAKWTICPMSVTLASEENEEGSYVKATDTMTYPKEEGTLLSWDEAATTEDSYKAVYDVRDKSFTLPDLSRRGYDFKGWRDADGNVWPRVKIDPAVQATWDKTQYHLTYEPVFEEIEYTIVLEPNKGGLERQTEKRRFTEEFTFPYPVALNTGAVFSAWANKDEEPYMDDPDYREFYQAKTYPMSPGIDENGAPTFCLTDLTTDEERTITLYAIWNGSYKVTVPLVANMAIDTETGDVVAGKTTLWNDKEDVEYNVESLRYEPVKDVATGQVPFQGAYEVYFSIYPGLSFQNDADAYYFLQKAKVGDKGAVTYADKAKDGEDTTVAPILVKLGGTDATPKLFTRTSLSNDPDEVTLDSVTGDTYGFYSFGKDKPLDVYYGIHFADSATWKDTLKRFSIKENATTWTLPKNDAGNQTDTTNGRKLGWSSDRVDIAKVRYTLSMTKTTPSE